MKLKLKVDDTTTVAELRLLGELFTGLAGEYAAAPYSTFTALSAPTDEAELEVLEPSCVPLNREEPVVHIEGINILTGKPEPKRRRRTKGEIEAAAQDSGATLYWSHPESDSFGSVIGRAEMDKVLTSDLLTVEVTKEQYLALVEAKKEIAATEAKAKAEAGKDHPAPTPTATATDTPAASSSEGAAETPATESPSDTKTYTPAEVQKIAVATAGRFGPEKVKAIIAQYPGAARIADLPLTELAGFVAKLNAVS